MATCDDRQLTEAQRQAGYQQGRTGVQQAVRPFTGRPTLENLIDYINRELQPAVKRTRDRLNDVYLPAVDNAPSGNPLSFYFSTSTTNADPTTGRIRLDQATQDTATTIRVSETNGRLADVAPWLDVMAGGATSPLGVVTLSDAINPARFIRFDLTAMVDRGVYWDLSVTPIESSHDNPFADDGAIAISFIPGVGATPATVPPGSITPIAANTVVGNPTAATAAPTAIAVDDLSVLGRKGLAGTGNLEDITVPGTATTTGESMFLRSPSVRTSLQFSNWTLVDMPLMSDNVFVGNITGATRRPVYTALSSLSSTTVLYENVGKTFIREALTGDVTAPQNSNVTTITDNAVTLAKLATQANNTVLANVSGSTAVPSAVGLSTLANNSLSYDATNHRFDYIGSTSVINITPSGAQGVVNIAALLCGGAVTVQPTAAFDIDGFTAMPTGFWFDLVYRDTTTFRGTLNENTGATTTSIRNPGAVALAFTTQETIRLKYYNTRWRVVGVSTRPLASTFPGAPIYDVMASPFNAVADGTTDDTAAINAAIVAANAAPGVIYLGDNHRITAALTSVTSDGVFIQGRGRWQNASVVRVDAASSPTAVFTFDNVNYGGIADVWIRGVGALYTSGSAVLFDGCGGCRAQRLYISQLYNGVDIFECIQTDVESVTFDDLYGQFAVRASGNGSSCHTTYITRCYGQNDLAQTQVGSVTAWQATTAYVAGNAVTNGGQIYQATVGGTSGATGPSTIPGTTVGTAHSATITDGSVTWVWAGGSIVWYLQDSFSTTFRVTDCAGVGGGYGLIVQDTLGDTPQFTRVHNLECDHNASGAVKLDGGRQAEFSQLFVTSVLNGIGVEVTANQEGDWLFRDGFMFGVPFEGFVISADMGALSDFTICGCSTRTANTYDAVRVDANVSHWNIADCTIGFAHNQAAQSRYGISIASGCDNYSVIGNRLLGHDTAAILNTPLRATTRIVRNNVPDDTTAGNSLSFTASTDQYDYIGSTSAINITPSGAQGVVDISTLLCGGCVTLQPTGTFDIDGFTVKATGFWFDLIYRDTTTHVGTLNENTGGVTTSIRNPGNAAVTFTTQEAIRFRYQQSRWRVAGRSSRSFSLTDGDKGDITVASSGTSWTIDASAVTTTKIADANVTTIKILDANVTLPKLATQVTETVVANVSGSTASPTAVALSSLVNAAVSLTYDSTNHRFTYSGATTTINLTPTGAVGVVDISTLPCGGVVTLQPSADFNIDGFTAKTTGFWFLLNYRDTTTRIGTLNENTGATTTSIRNPGNTAFTFTTQETILFVYSNTRWRTAAPLRISDGDKGDITVTSSGATWTIDNAAVTLAKQADLAQSRIIGRAEGAGTGVPTALTPTQVVAIIDGENATWTGVHSFTGASHTIDVTGALRVVTNGTERLEIEPDGAWQLSGDQGGVGALMLSQGDSAPPIWGNRGDVVTRTTIIAGGSSAEANIVSLVVAAGTWVVGTTYEFYAHCEYVRSGATATSHTVTIDAELNGTGIGITLGVLSGVQNSATASVLVHGTFTCSATGGAGTGRAAIAIDENILVGSTATLSRWAGSSSPSLDTTASNTLSITVDFSAGVTGASFVCQRAWIRRVA